MDRIIFHIDVNSAFLSWTAVERLHNPAFLGQPDLRSIPSVIGGDQSTRHGIVLAKSIPAKKYGISTAEPLVGALRKCPGLVIVPSDHHMYEEKSQELMNFLATISPLIQQVSIDECYMDFTCIQKDYTSAENAAAFIKDQVRERFGFTVNIGISDKKVLAKMASDFQKPDRVHTLYTSEIQKKMWPLPVSSLFMCGKSSSSTLNKLGIVSIGELARADLSVLSSHLKSHGQLLWEYANGIDDSPVQEDEAQLKGIGNSTTSAKDLTDIEEIRAVLLALSESVSARLRASGQLAEIISTEIKYSTFQSVSHQAAFLAPTASTNIIYEKSCSLFEELWNGAPIRLLGVRTTKLVPNDIPVQMSLSDYTSESNNSSEKMKRLDSAIDEIRGKYGKASLTRGSLVKPSSSKKMPPQENKKEE